MPERICQAVGHSDETPTGIGASYSPYPGSQASFRDRMIWSSIAHLLPALLGPPLENREEAEELIDEALKASGVTLFAMMKAINKVFNEYSPGGFIH